MALVALSSLLLFVAAGCFTVVLVHAFKRSVGTGVMVLLIPVFNIVYGVGQFEHRYKGLVLAGWLGGFVLGVVLRAVGLSLGAQG